MGGYEEEEEIEKESWGEADWGPWLIYDLAIRHSTEFGDIPPSFLPFPELSTRHVTPIRHRSHASRHSSL